MPLPILASAGGPAVENRLLIVLIQLTVVILVARVFATLFRKLGQPAVVGEILAGLILGPSVFGRVEIGVGRLLGTGRAARFLAGNGVSHAIFNSSVNDVMSILSQLGLIFLLFLIGLEFDFKHLKANSTAALSISLVGIALPFGFGMALAHWMHPHLLEFASLNLRGFSLFMGTAMSITAIPILGRIMMELNITRTRLGAITISAAAIDDATAWIVLAAVSALVRADFNVLATVKMILLTIGYAALMMFVAKPIFHRLIKAELKRSKGELGLNALAALFAMIFLCAIATNLIGIFAIFGAFMFGAVLSDEAEFREAVVRQLRNFVTVFFLPIFFTYTGLRTNIGTLDTAQLWLFAAAVSFLAVLGKFGGCGIAARLSGFTGRESACIGVMMNTRALMELIVINVGFELKVIPASVFCMLVMMAVLTTIMTTPILLRLMRGTELEPLIRQTTFRRGRASERAMSVAAVDGGLE